MSKNNLDNKIIFRQATSADLESIISMLADDPLGSQRENFTFPLPNGYQKAFLAIELNPNSELWVAEFEQQVVGVAQIDFITYLTYQGGTRGLIEGVRVNKNFRSLGIGKLLFEKLISRAKAKHCHMVQLTTNKERPEALAFYQRLGFVASHEGLKLNLES